jgi:phage baseplate assembly protein W
MSKTIGIAFPIKDTQDGGVFRGTTTTDQTLRSDLIALLTLRRGQRPMQSRMFSPIFDYIFEPLDQISQSELETKIKEKVKEFIPQVEVSKVLYNPQPESNLLGIKIYYKIRDFFGQDESIELNIPTESFNNA